MTPEPVSPSRAERLRRLQLNKCPIHDIHMYQHNEEVIEKTAPSKDVTLVKCPRCKILGWTKREYGASFSTSNTGSFFGGTHLLPEFEWALEEIRWTDEDRKFLSEMKISL